MTKPIKLCVIGAGAFANYAHGPSMKILSETDPGLELAAVSDLDPEKAETFAEKFGFRRTYADWRRMLALEQPDGTAVLTGVAATADIGSAVLATGCPIMLEKPPGRTRDEIMKIIEAGKKSGAPAMAAFNRRYSPLLRQLLAIREVECGEPVEHLRCDFFRHERLDDDFSTTSIHGIDAMRHLSGSHYAEVTLRYQELEREKPTMNIFLFAGFANKVSGVISFCPSTGAAFERYTVCTRRWTLIAETVIPGAGADAPGRIFVYRDGKLLRIEDPTPHRLNSESIYLAGYFSENAAFIENLRHGFPENNDLEMSLDAVEIADALRHRQPCWSRNHGQS
jgi:predicted dehydrogenase